MDTATINEEIASRVVEAQGSTATAALADATGIPRTTLKRSLSGDRPFTVPELYKIGSALGADWQGFLPGPDSTAAPPGQAAA